MIRSFCYSRFSRYLLPGWLVFALPASAAELLTLDRALERAMQNHPQLHQAQAAVDASKARSEQARSNLLPQINAGANYVPSLSSSRTSNGANLSLSADQVLYDFGQNSNRYEAATVLSSAQEDSWKLARLQVAQEVRAAYFAAKAAESTVKVALESLQNQQRHLDQVKGFVQIGTRPPIDLAQAQKDVANAQVQLIEAQNSFEIAKAQLSQAMGVEEGSFSLASTLMPAVPGEEQSLERLLKEALDHHPEYASLTKQRNAQTLTVRTIKAVGMPTLRATTRLAEDTTRLSEPSWEAGVAFSWPLFNGGATKAQLSEAEANLAKLDAQLVLLRQRIRLDLEKARLAVKGGKAAREAAGKSTKNAMEQLKLAEGRYLAGLGSVLELGDAQLALTNAKAQEIQVEYKLASARIQLLAALGRTGL